MQLGPIIYLVLPAVVILLVLTKSIVIIRQAEKGIVERLGRYKETLDPGLRVLIPFIDGSASQGGYA